MGHYRRFIELEPGQWSARYAIGLTLIKVNRWAEARATLEDAHAGFPEAREITGALVRVLAASPDDSVRDGGRALEIAVELARGRPTLDEVEALAMALAEAGRYPEAARYQEAAVRAALEAGREDLVGRLESNLARYRDGQPCREPWPPDDPLLAPGQKED